MADRMGFLVVQMSPAADAHVAPEFEAPEQRVMAAISAVAWIVAIGACSEGAAKVVGSSVPATPCRQADAQGAQYERG